MLATGLATSLTALGLFFVPAAVASVKHGPLLRGSLVALSIVIVVSTALVMLVTAWVARLASPSKDANKRNEGIAP